MKKRILIVDDNKAILSALTILLSSYFNEIITLTSPKEIPSILRSKDIDVILLDMNFTASINSGNEGLFWLSEIKKIKASLPVVVFTAYADIELAVEAIKRGATDFVVKPWDNTKLINTLCDASRKDKASKGKSDKLKNKSDMYWGDSLPMLTLKHTIEKVSSTDVNILITGENGTGKEVLAREIHSKSLRASSKLVTVDMGAITETLFESELFGHVKGSFTGAHADRIGKFEEAKGGTLFLDEIGNLPYHLQAKLLTALQSRSIVKVGSNKPEEIDVRLVCATNMNLEKMVDQGTFREDLFYRINTIQTHIPSLSERKEDIIPLSKRFISRYCDKYHKTISDITPDGVLALEKHNWAGNIRELQHTIEKAVILCDGNSISAKDLLLKTQAKKTDAAATSEEATTLESLEKQAIEKAMMRNNGNMSAVAQDLGITRQTLYNKIKKYSL